MSKIIDDFKVLKNDKDKWAFVLANKSKIRLELDNDDTIVVDDNASDDDEDNCASFAYYVGWSEGVITLLQSLGLDADSC